MRKNIKEWLDSPASLLNVLLVIIASVIIYVLVVVILRISFPKYEEVLYDCGSHLVKGTEVPNSTWDLEGGVDAYYFYPGNDSVSNRKYEVPIREWFENFNAVGLNKGEGGCKEILRFYEKK